MGNAARQIKRRREKEQRYNTSRKPKWSKEKKTRIAVICGIVGLVVLLFLMFWTPAGTVKTWFGKPMFVSDNSILVENHDYYYSLGTYTLPDGYTQDKDYSVVKDPNRFELKAVPNKEDNSLGYFYLTPIASPNLDAIHSSFKGMYEDVSEMQEMNILGKEAQWFSYSYPADQTTPSEYVRNICIYIPAAHECDLLLSLYSKKTAQDALPTEEQMLAQVDIILSGLKFQ